MKLPRNDRHAKARLHSPYPETMQRKDAGRIEMLKRKLKVIQEEILAATRCGDAMMKGWLDTKAADLQATIFRAENLVAR